MANLTGTNGNNTINGTNDAGDTIAGLAGSDTINANLGNDTVSGGDGADTINGGDGDDVLYGHGSADLAANSGVINVTRVATGLGGATCAVSPPGEPTMLYVTRKDIGDIVRVNTATGAQETFLDLEPNTDFAPGGEQGLLCVAFHPDYDINGRFFVFLTNPSGDVEVREYKRSTTDPSVADPTMVQSIITIPHPTNANHNGGFVGFGPDGKLYITVGDGGGGNDPNNNAQNKDVLLGKLLRLDIDDDDFPADNTRNYAIPSDNPFVGEDGADEIWDLGLRNPFRMSFDSANGDIYIGDVGQGRREEIDYHAASTPGGVNFGWRIREGSLPNIDGPPGDYTDPVFEYGRDIGNVITGGIVYHGPAAGLQGAYVFADFGSDRFFTLRMVNGVAVDAIEHTSQIVSTHPLTNIASFGTDGMQRLYAVSLGGDIFRIDPSAAAGDGGDTIRGGDGLDRIYGGAGNDMLFGDNGNDQITGGLGADAMSGGAGNDRFTVDNALDTTIEAVNGGIDNAAASVTYTIGANVEHLYLTGTGNIGGTGNAGNNSIFGNAGANTINGGDGNDMLYGGAGADTMNGGAGNDLYIVDVAGDNAVEAQDAGSDQVNSLVSITLAANIERLTLIGTGNLNAVGNPLANVITGNDGHNRLRGSSGNDSLNGRGGADNLDGGDGNDFFTVDNTADKAVEAANAGIDRVFSTAAFTLGANVEHMSLRGTGNINGTGNTLNNTLAGNAANNILRGSSGNDSLNGSAGNDILIGGAGKDAMTGGAGADDFDFNSIVEIGNGATRDIIRDFVHLTDDIDLSTIDANGAAIGNTAFSFLAAHGAAFTGAAAQLRWFRQDLAGTANDRTIVEGDINGNRVADFMIELAGLKVLTAADFVL